MFLQTFLCSGILPQGIIQPQLLHSTAYCAHNHGMVWCGNRVAWHGMVWCGMAWHDVVWHGVVWYGLVWCGIAWHGVVWYCMVWYGVVWLLKHL